MTRKEFETLLRQRLTGLPAEDRERSVAYFNEMLDEHIETGEAEEEAVAALGDMDAIVADILSETSLPKLIREKMRPRRALRAWEIVLLVLGSPLWLSLLLAGFAVLISVYAVLWSAVLCCWVMAVAFGACALAAIPLSVVFGLHHPASGALLLGGGIFCAGLALLMIPVSVLASGAVWRLGKAFLRGIKSLFAGKEQR